MHSFTFVLNSATPKLFAYADKPLNLGGKIEYLPLKDIQERVGFVYNESISIDSETKIGPFKENITGNILSSHLKQQIEKILKAANDGLVICKTDRGHGVFASKDIPEATVVALYSGTLINGRKVSSQDDYACGFYGTNLAVSTRNHRGIASLMQHLPEKPKFDNPKAMSDVLKMFGQDVSEEKLKAGIEFYSTEFDSAEIRELVVTENINREYVKINNIPVIAMVTTRQVQAGEQLGFNYGPDYWTSRNVTPDFFTKHGSVVPRGLYKRTFGQLNFDDFSYTGEYQPLVNQLEQGKTSITLMGDDKNSHVVRGAELLFALLSVNACKVGINFS